MFWKPILEELTDRHYGCHLLVVAAAGTAAALALTWFMHDLIHSDQQPLDETARAHPVDFVRVKREERSVSKNLRPARPTLAAAPPAPAVPETDSSRVDTTLNIPAPIVPDTMGAELNIGGLGLNFSEGDYMPIVKVAPVYPQQAHYRGIEGECVVVYTVTITGSTRDVRVVEDMCTNRIFHKSSIDAARKFKYKPRVIDGEAVEVHGVMNFFTYDIQGIGD